MAAGVPRGTRWFAFLVCSMTLFTLVCGLGNGVAVVGSSAFPTKYFDCRDDRGAWLFCSFCVHHPSVMFGEQRFGLLALQSSAKVLLVCLFVQLPPVHPFGESCHAPRRLLCGCLRCDPFSQRLVDSAGGLFIRLRIWDRLSRNMSNITTLFTIQTMALGKT